MSLYRTLINFLKTTNVIWFIVFGVLLDIFWYTAFKFYNLPLNRQLIIAILIVFMLLYIYVIDPVLSHIYFIINEKLHPENIVTETDLKKSLKRRRKNEFL